jgi:hypothetical protein
MWKGDPFRSLQKFRIERLDDGWDSEPINSSLCRSPLPLQIGNQMKGLARAVFGKHFELSFTYKSTKTSFSGNSRLPVESSNGSPGHKSYVLVEPSVST